MLNKALLTISIAILPFCASAQLPATAKGTAGLIAKDRLNRNSPIKDFRNHILSHVTSQSRLAAKTTADNACRVIAVTDRTYNGASYDPMDSATVTYSGTRGSLFRGAYSGWVIKFDNVNTYVYDMASSTYSNESKLTQTFDASNNILNLLEQQWITSGSWENVYQAIYTYTASNNIATEIEQNWNTTSGAWENNDRITNTYTAANKIATELYESWTTTWENNVRFTYTYDLSNNLTDALIEGWNTSSLAWEVVYKDTYTYDASGNMLTDIGQQWDATTAIWVNDSKTINAYDALNNKTSMISQAWDTTTASWVNYAKELYNSFTSIYPGIIVYQGWDSASAAFYNSYRDSFVFNSFSQPTHNFGESWNSGSSTWEAVSGDYFSRYYYETYTTALQNVSGKGNADIYPVPAKNALSIDVTWTAPQAFTISIIDVQGRLHSSWGVPACTKHTEIVPIDNLPAGNYFIRMKGPKDEIIRKITVEK